MAWEEEAPKEIESVEVGGIWHLACVEKRIPVHNRYQVLSSQEDEEKDGDLDLGTWPILETRDSGKTKQNRFKKASKFKKVSWDDEWFIGAVGDERGENKFR